MNVAGILGAVVSSGFATLHDLDVNLGTEDLYDLAEIIAVNSYNHWVMVSTPPRI